MGTKCDGSDILTGRVHNSDSAVPIAYPNVSHLLIISDVVGIATKPEGLSHSQRFSVIDAKLAVSSCGDIESAIFQIVVNPLWFFESFDLRGALPLPCIEDFDGAIFESGNESAFTEDIHRKMIDPPFYTWQWDFLV